MNTLPSIFVLTAATVGSFTVALLVQWLTLRALFLAMPGRHKATATQVALQHTRRLVMPTSSVTTSHQSLVTGASH